MSEVLELTKELVKRESITPLDEGCQDLVATRLKKLGFAIKHLPFGEVSNLWATYGKGEKTLKKGIPKDVPVYDNLAAVADALLEIVI